MIDGGIIMIMLGALSLLILPTRASIDYHRWRRTAPIGATLRASVPMAPPTRDLERLAEQAEIALARDQLLGSVASIAGIYDRA